ncbi:MAG TPA: transcription termination factor NusA, partial [Pyrinomonadaceae bacterium]|nr:transcription termination factor NusA [Pyrinomonadaceae bacterium]
ALLLPLPMEELGRIAAQTAKQILFQKVRDAVRSNVYEQYIDKIGDLVNGYVKRFERGNIIVDLGNLEAILPRSQQSRGEQWNQGERIRVVINNVSKESKGPQVEVSRTSPELLLRLFEMEVPEIYDGTVVIKSAVREPGERAKIAVMSNERDVDPVGACVGMKGSRVQAIIRELRGEKIDIIEWSDEPSVFAANALSPAKVNQVRITDIENRQMEVIVNEDQLSLAIGKRGQNVRLATKLVGWNIDIRSEEEIKREVTEQMGALIASGEAVPLSAIEGVTAAQAEALAEHGINDIDALAATSVDDLVEFLDLSLDEAEVILEASKAITALRDRSIGEDGEEIEEQHAVSAEFDESMDEEVEPSLESTAEGYDEAVENGVPFSSEPEIPARDSADPVPVTEAEAIPADEIALQEAGRDLRPDTITPSPDITSSGVEAFEHIDEVVQEMEDEELASEATAEEAETSAPAVSEETASGGRTDDDENH